MVRIIDYPKEKLDYNSILSTSPMHFGFITSWKWQCQLFVIPNKQLKWMNNLVGGFAPPCSQHKDAASPDGVDAKTKKKKKSAESLCHGSLENTK